MMTTSNFYEEISRTLPAIMYISGKTSTGKSTFARRLHDTFGYDVIGLEDVLVGITRKNHLDEGEMFHDVFYADGPNEQKDLYLSVTDKLIKSHLRRSQRLVIEGAVSNSTFLQRILQPAGNLPVAYFHPDNLDIYVRNLTARFMQSSKDSQAGLPLKFWRHIDKNEFTAFCATRELTDNLKESIRKYAVESQQASYKRLEQLQEVFSEVTVVSIE